MKRWTKIPNFTIRAATEQDVSVILSLIRGLAQYEKLAHEVVATEDLLRTTLFGGRTVAEVILGEIHDEPVSFALFFHNYSTFLGRPGLFIEDLYVKPQWRGKGIGSVMLAYVASLAKERKCGRLEWSVLDWNEPAWRFYKKLGATPMDGWTVHRLTGKALESIAADF